MFFVLVLNSTIKSSALPGSLLERMLEYEQFKPIFSEKGLGSILPRVKLTGATFQNWKHPQFLFMPQQFTIRVFFTKPLLPYGSYFVWHHGMKKQSYRLRSYFVCLSYHFTLGHGPLDINSHRQSDVNEGSMPHRHTKRKLTA